MMTGKAPRLSKRDRQQAAEELGLLALTVNSDMRSPLHVMRGFAEIIAKDPDLAVDERTEYAGRIVSASDDMKEYVYQLLIVTIGLAQAARDDALEPCDIVKLINESIPDSGNGPKIQVLPEFSNGHFQVWGIEQILRGVISNLLDAVILRSTTDQTVTITRRDDTHGSWLCVQDHGPDINDKKTKQGSRASQALDIASALCKLHGGRLEARNLPEGGAEIVVLFPKEIVINAG